MLQELENLLTLTSGFFLLLSTSYYYTSTILFLPLSLSKIFFKSGKVQELLRLERRSEGLATLASRIIPLEWRRLSLILQSCKCQDPPGTPGPASPDTFISWGSLNIHGSLHFPASLAAVLGRASSLSPDKWE